MTTNRLTQPTNDNVRIIPPKDPQERIAFWIARGNADLAERNMHGLRWSHVNGSYFIEPHEAAERRAEWARSKA